MARLEEIGGATLGFVGEVGLADLPGSEAEFVKLLQ